MPIQPQAVIFDYGNVLCAPQEASDLSAMAQILQVPDAEFYPIYWRYRLPYDESGLNAHSYWQKVAKDLERSATDLQVQMLSQLDVESWSRPSPVMVSYANALYAAGMPTAILSNMPADLRLHLQTNVPWLPRFTFSTYSCDVQMVKPRQGIYEHCLSGLGVRPGEALFFDDRPENVEAARKLGIHAVLFTTPEAAVSELAGKYILPASIEC